MKQTYNTPQPINLIPQTKPELSGQKLLDKLEDDFSCYREDAGKGYFVSDPKVVSDFIAKIKAARKALSQHQV